VVLVPQGADGFQRRGIDLDPRMRMNRGTGCGGNQYGECEAARLEHDFPI
jgi:hypothetical protein